MLLDFVPSHVVARTLPGLIRIIDHHTPYNVNLNSETRSGLNDYPLADSENSPVTGLVLGINCGIDTATFHLQQQLRLGLSRASQREIPHVPYCKQINQRYEDSKCFFHRSRN